MLLLPRQVLARCGGECRSRSIAVHCDRDHSVIHCATVFLFLVYFLFFVYFLFLLGVVGHGCIATVIDSIDSIEGGVASTVIFPDSSGSARDLILPPGPRGRVLNSTK